MLRFLFGPERRSIVTPTQPGRHTPGAEADTISGDPESHDGQHHITRLLDRWSDGDTGVLAELMPLVYADLRRLAGRSLRRERPDHTLQPTALVHEAYMRLAKSAPPDLGDREHFLCLAARLMRQILVDHARRAKADRRGGEAPKVPLEEHFEEAERRETLPAVDLLALDEALKALANLEPRKARVIELRFFGGFEVKEVAKLLEVSVPTVVTDTRVARAWLLARIDDGPSS